MLLPPQWSITTGCQRNPWPRLMEASELAFPSNVEKTVENALASDVCNQMEANFNPERFVPYVMMHEFEAILFSDCGKFAEGIEKPELAPEFQAIRDEFECPEEIDDSPESAPSQTYPIARARV